MPTEMKKLTDFLVTLGVEQVPRSQLGWGYRRAAYRRMAERLGGAARATYDRVFAQEPVESGTA